MAGALAFGGLLVVRQDAPLLWHGLTHDGGLVAICGSAAAGLLTLVLVWGGTFGPARASAALAVAAIMAGWATAQRPRFLPGLTIDQAAAGRSTLIAIIVGVAIGAIVLVPSLLLLFALFLRGRLDIAEVGTRSLDVSPRVDKRPPRLAGVSAAAGLVAGVGLTVAASGWAQALGIVCLCAFAGITFVLAATTPDQHG
jgi:cytochrome d ubiquinol oxidase subunit II